MSFMKQTDFEAYMRALAGSDKRRQDANETWARSMWNVLKDGGILQSPDNSYPTLTKVEARKGWTFDA